MKSANSGVETKRPSLMELALVRDCLIVCICLDNASRTGAFANITRGEFKITKNKGGKFMLNTFDYKIVGTLGLKTMYFSNTLIKEENIYFHKFRSNLDETTALEIEPFLVSLTMQKMLLPMFGRKENGHRMNPLMVRKSCVTKAHEAKPYVAQSLANLMRQSNETVKQLYYLQEK